MWDKINNMNNARNKRVPAAVVNYCCEHEELSPEDVRQFILRQIEFYNAREDKHGATVEDWIAIRLETTPRRAIAAIRWAQERKQ